MKKVSVVEEIEKTAKKTADITVKFVKWIFFLLVIYIAVVTVLGYIASGTDFLTNVATLSVGGFWAFFFGYFGWRIAEIVEKHFMEKITHENNGP